MKKSLILVFIMILFPLINAIELNAQEPIIIQNENGKYPANFEYLFDSDNNLTIDKISSKEFSGKFEKCGKEGININFVKIPIWVRLSIQNESDIEEFFLEYAWSMSPDVYLFIPDEEGIFSDNNVKEGGYLIPYNDREIRHRNSIFPIICKKGENKTYYLKITGKELEIKLTIWNKEVFYEKDSFIQLIFVLLIGMLIIMILYNLFLLVSIKDISYFFFVCYNLGIIFFEACYNGIILQFLPSSIFLERIYFISLCFLNLALVLILKSFLNTKNNFKKFNKLLLFFAVIFASLMPSVFAPDDIFFYTKMVINIFPVVPYTPILIVRLLFIIRKNNIARYIVIAYIIILISGVSFALVKFNIIPSNIITRNTLLYSAIIQVLFISFAFADKLNIMRKEKEHAQELAIHNHQLAIENLRKADALKDEFLANTSHELRTPINGIIGITNAIMEKKADNIPLKMIEQISLINTSSKRLYTLINDILDYSRLKHSDIKLYRKSVDIKRLADVVIMLCKSLTMGKPLALINGISEEIPFVYADENRLQQIFYNLIGNAIKFTDNGNISIFAEKSNDMIKISVTDTGIGAPKGKEEEIFNAFENIDTAGRNSSGIGLGLNITKKLVELHNGKIWVESNNDKGSKFIFTLPISTDEKVIDSEHFNNSLNSEILQNETLEPKLIKRENPLANILIVDDELMNILILINAFQETNYNITVAYNGQQALDMIDKNAPYDLILLDVMMPILSGFDVCKKLREKYSMFVLPIIILTAKNTIDDIAIGFQIGANDYIPKPFNKEELLARVDTTLKLKKVTDELQLLNKELENKVAERTIELENTNAELKSFYYSVTHDLKTPIYIIENCKEIYEKKWGKDFTEEQKNLFFYIEKNSKQIIELINDILTFAQISEGNITISQINISNAVRIAISETKMLYPDKNIEFIIEDNLFVNADRKLLSIMLNNLINNSIKYSSKKEKPIIEFGCNNTDGENVFFIKDNGVGFDQKFADRIFLPFERLHSKKDYEGTGIGLSIVQRIIKRHNGKIWVESKENFGTTFFFTINIKS